MTQTFTVEIKDEDKRRIIIDRAAWKLENLKKGDFVKVTIEKVEK
jgi:hypothetical protein